MQEKSLPRIRRSLEKFGPGPLARFDAMCRLFDLKPELKRLVDAIVTEFAKDPRIAELYNLWYEQKESGIRFYQDEMPERVPLTDNPEFRTVKNMIFANCNSKLQ